MSTRQLSLDINLPQLQNLIKRDKESYRDDFYRQYRHFQTTIDIIKLQPDSDPKQFCDLCMFIANVAYCYPEDTKDLSTLLMNLLRAHSSSISVSSADIRKAIVQSLMQLRSNKMVEQITLLSLFFSLLKTRDKSLRAQIRLYIETEIKRSNQKAKNNKLNKALQNHILSMVMGDIDSGIEGNDYAILIAIQICKDMYAKAIWNDSKTVSIIANGLFSSHNKVVVASLKFFLGKDEKDNGDCEEDEESVDIKRMEFRTRVGKKSRGKEAKLEKAMKIVKKKERQSSRAEDFNFSALHMLNDPQGLAEKLFSRMADKEVKFELKLMYMDLISRIVGIHKLILLNFYPFLLRYLKPHMSDVTQVMAACAQASHDLVPPDALEQVIRTIVDQFVTDAYSGEVIAAGINAIREITKRCPLSIDEELLAYLVTFKNHRDKGVNIAAKSIIGLFREVGPEMLPKKERGKEASMAVQRGLVSRKKFGQTQVAEGIEGAELLLESGNDEVEEEGEELAEWEEAESSDNDPDEEDEEGWINVSSDDELNLPDDIQMDKKDKKYKVFYGFKYDREKINEEKGNDEDFEEAVIENDHEKKVEQKTQNRVDTMRILTPADFERLKVLKNKAKAEQIAGTKRPNADVDKDDDGNEDNIVSATTIEGYHRRKKASKEERIASIMEGRKDRPKYGSKKGSKDRGSLTNREKAKNKNFMMIVHKREVVAKKKMSLRDKQMRKRKHIEREKKSI